MAYGLYHKLDQNRWYRGDFSSDNKLTGTIYTDINQVTAKNLTGFTVKIRMSRPKQFGDFFNKEATIVVAGDGTWSYAVAEGEIPPRGIYFVKIEIRKSGVVESSLNRQELQVIQGPSGGA